MTVIWMNPPVTVGASSIPTTPMTESIAKISQSMVQLLNLLESPLSRFLAPQVFSPVFVIAPLFGFR